MCSPNDELAKLFHSHASKCWVLAADLSNLINMFQREKATNLFTFTEISVRICIPGLMCAVFSLKSLQNAAIWICICPSSGPSGGAGVAFPAGILVARKVFRLTFSTICVAALRAAILIESK
jgi:hypothetical protein